MAAQRSDFTQAEARERVRGDLGLRSTNLLTDGELNAWLKTGQGDFAQYTGWYQKDNQPVSVTAGTMLCDFPADALSIRELRWLNLPLLLTTVEGLERANWAWRQVGNGTPRLWFRRGMTSFGLHLTPDVTDATSLKMDYVATPPNPTSDTDFYTIPTTMDEAIITYAKLQASMKDASGEGERRIERYRSQWQQYLSEGLALVNSAAEAEPIVFGANAHGVDVGYYDPILFAHIPAPP